jgi:hypothetical protein
MRIQMKNLIGFTAHMTHSRELSISSKARLAVFYVDFGHYLGFPEFVRQPQRATTEGVIYLMPKSRGDDVDAALCLSNDDWERLDRDKTWSEFLGCIG